MYINNLPSSEKPTSTPQHPSPSPSSPLSEVAARALANPLPASTSSFKAKDLTKEQDIQNHSCYQWKCVDRKEVSPGCFLYAYQLRDELNPLINNNWLALYQSVHKASYPALEHHAIILETRGGFSMSAANPGRPTDTDMHLEELGFQIQRSLLGYSYDTVMLPDPQTLMMRWNNLVDRGIVKHRLKVVTSEAIAPHREFIQGYIDNDVLISTGKEAFHDMLVHVVPTISRIIDCERKGQDYNKLREETTTAIKHDLDLIKQLEEIDGAVKKGQIGNPSKEIQTLIQHLPALEASLGLFVDNMTVTYTAEEILTLSESTKGDDPQQDAKSVSSGLLCQTVSFNSPWIADGPKYFRFFE